MAMNEDTTSRGAEQGAEAFDDAIAHCAAVCATLCEETETIARREGEARTQAARYLAILDAGLSLARAAPAAPAREQRLTALAGDITGAAQMLATMRACANDFAAKDLPRTCALAEALGAALDAGALAHWPETEGALRSIVETERTIAQVRQAALDAAQAFDPSATWNAEAYPSRPEQTFGPKARMNARIEREGADRPLDEDEAAAIEAAIAQSGACEGACERVEVRTAPDMPTWKWAYRFEVDTVETTRKNQRRTITATDEEAAARAALDNNGTVISDEMLDTSTIVTAVRARARGFDDRDWFERAKPDPFGRLRESLITARKSRRSLLDAHALARDIIEEFENGVHSASTSIEKFNNGWRAWLWPLAASIVLSHGSGYDSGGAGARSRGARGERKRVEIATVQFERRGEQSAQRTVIEVTLIENATATHTAIGVRRSTTGGGTEHHVGASALEARLDTEIRALARDAAILVEEGKESTQ